MTTHTNALHGWPGWTHSGSSVSGCGYGFDIYRQNDASNGRVYGVRYRLALGQFYSCLMPAIQTPIIEAGSFDQAYMMGERFAHAMRQWQVVQNRNRAMSQGIAVIGV